MQTAIEYVVRTADGAWRVNGTRVSLDSIVHAFHDGATPETIRADFPSLSLEQIYGALTFYLGNQPEIDQYLAGQEANWERLRQSSEAANGDVLQRLRSHQ